MRKNCVTCKHDHLHNPICDECYNTSDAPTKWEAAGYYEPDTNADRIRAMSDEELVVFVRAVIVAEDCPVSGCACDKCFFKEPCFNGSKWHGKEREWLKQPAEEGDGNG